MSQQIGPELVRLQPPYLPPPEYLKSGEGIEKTGREQTSGLLFLLALTNDLGSASRANLYTAATCPHDVAMNSRVVFPSHDYMLSTQLVFVTHLPLGLNTAHCAVPTGWPSHQPGQRLLTSHSSPLQPQTTCQWRVRGRARDHPGRPLDWFCV